MTAPEVVFRQVEGACAMANSKAIAKREEPPVWRAHVSREGAVIVLQTKLHREERVSKGWTYITPKFATAAVWGAISELASTIRARLPDSDVSCTSCVFRPHPSWRLVYELQERQAVG